MPNDNVNVVCGLQIKGVSVVPTTSTETHIRLTIRGHLRRWTTGNLRLSSFYREMFMFMFIGLSVHPTPYENLPGVARAWVWMMYLEKKMLNTPLIYIYNIVCMATNVWSIEIGYQCYFMNATVANKASQN